MKHIATSELKGAALDWAVAIAEGLEIGEDNKPIWFGDDQPYYEAARRAYNPSTDWAQGGPIIEREGIFVGPWGHAPGGIAWKSANKKFEGPTPLIAAMRCYVASKLGDTVEIPDEL